MASIPRVPSQSTIRRIEWLQAFTIIWMSIEAALSLVAAWMARSPALVAFGGDSAIELFSASVVLWRFRVHAGERAEKLAARAGGSLLLALALYVAVASGITLLGLSEAKPSRLGIVVLVAAALVMPQLAKEKRRLAAVTGSATLRADAAESALCGLLSLIALAGLVVTATLHVTWADPVAALSLLPFIVREGWTAMRESDQSM